MDDPTPQIKWDFPKHDTIPTPGIEPGPRRWERRILTTRPRGRSWHVTKIICLMLLLLILHVKSQFLNLVKGTLVPEAFFKYYLFSFRNLRREELIEAPSREKKKASGRDRWESHFHADSALDSCQRCHFLLTNHKGGSDLQFVDRAGWVSSPVLRNKLLSRERREAFAVFTSCQRKLLGSCFHS